MKFGVDLLMLREGIRAEFREDRIHVDLADGGKMVARANICATGVEYERLQVPGHGRFLGAGLAYGAGRSEAALCAGEHVVVVGGANSARQAVSYFAAHCPKVTMLIRGPYPSASMSRYLSDRIFSLPNVEVRTDSEVASLHGERGLEAVTVLDTKTQERRELPTRRLFVCIGGKPNTEWAAGTPIVRDEARYLVTGPDLLKDGKPPESWPLARQPYFLGTSVPGSFAVGDVRHGSVKRFASAIGEGAMCVTFVHRHLRETR